jgi:hypothetical protein
MMERTLDEHALLYEVAAVLMQHAPLNPSRIYPETSPALSAMPESIRDYDLPTQVLPGEGFPKLAEFWSGMGNRMRWKPAVYLVVTVPVILLPVEVAGAMVTTYIAKYRKMENPDVLEVRIRIGGRVLDGSVAPPVPLNSAAPVTVQLETPDGRGLRETKTDRDARFTFGGLAPGTYRLRFSHPNFGERTKDVEVSEEATVGEYDVLF